VIIERDLPMRCDDGLLLRADVFRPDHGRPVPVILTLGPYGKGVEYKGWCAAQWSWLLRTYPEILPNAGPEHPSHLLSADHPEELT
jgi:hypothetical protein